MQYNYEKVLWELKRKKLCKGYILFPLHDLRQCISNAAFHCRKYNSAAHWNAPKKQSKLLQLQYADCWVTTIFSIFMKWNEIRSRSASKWNATMINVAYKMMFFWCIFSGEKKSMPKSLKEGAEMENSKTKDILILEKYNIYFW